MIVLTTLLILTPVFVLLTACWIALRQAGAGNIIVGPTYTAIDYVPLDYIESPAVLEAEIIFGDG